MIQLKVCFNSTLVAIIYRTECICDIFQVRVRAIVQNIIKGGMPPNHVTKFLGLIIEDGNYFKSTFFFPHEKQVLDFNRCEPLNEFNAITYTCSLYNKLRCFSLGATRAVIKSLSDDEATKTDARNVMLIKGKKYNIERARVLIRNFLLVK